MNEILEIRKLWNLPVMEPLIGAYDEEDDKFLDIYFRDEEKL